MGTETILVVGGTGMLGEPVVRRLRANGFVVRILVRDAERARATLGPDVADMEGEVDDAAALEAAVAGCDGVHVSLGGGADPSAIDRVEHRGRPGSRRSRRGAGSVG